MAERAEVLKELALVACGEMPRPSEASPEPTLQYIEKLSTEDAHTQHEEQHQLYKEKPCERPTSSTRPERSRSYLHPVVICYTVISHTVINHWQRQLVGRNPKSTVLTKGKRQTKKRMLDVWLRLHEFLNKGIFKNVCDPEWKWLPLEREREKEFAEKGSGKFSGDQMCPVSSYRCGSLGVCFQANLTIWGVPTHPSVNYTLLKHLSSWLIIFSLGDSLLFPNYGAPKWCQWLWPCKIVLQLPGE